MKTKNLTMHHLLLLFCLFTHNIQSGLSDLIHNDPWKLLQDKFITGPNAKAAQARPTITKSLVGLGVTLGTGFAARQMYKKYLKIPANAVLSDYSDFQEKISSLSPYTIMPFAIVTGCLAYYTLHTTLVAHYQRENLKDLLNNWPQVKSRMPSSMQAGFDEIYKDYKTSPQYFSYKSDDIIRVIIQQINEKFEDKTYRKFWDAKVLTGNIILDIGNTIASCANIFKK